MSYDPSLTTNKDRVRWLIGDTSNVTATELSKDEEIQWAITQEANIYMAAASVAMAIYRNARAGGVQELKVGETRIRYDRSMEMLSLANDLRTRGSAYKVPTSGGVDKAETEAMDADTSLIQPSFGVGMMDNPNASKTTNEIS